MPVNVHALLVARLTAAAGVSAITTLVTSELTTGWTAPAVRVERIGGTIDDVAGHIDTARVQLDCYGSTEAQAWALRDAVTVALRAMPGAHTEGVVADVVSIAAAWSPDPAYDPPRPRVVVTATVIAHPTPS